jgi:hypothetical protein
MRSGRRALPTFEEFVQRDSDNLRERALLFPGDAVETPANGGGDRCRNWLESRSRFCSLHDAGRVIL